MQRCILLLAIVALLAPVALPQSSTGTVSGTVRDQSGAVIPNQTVTLTNTATNVSVPTRTNEVGFYYFPTVIPGPYRLTVEAPGMAKHEVTFTVQVSQSVVIDPVLRPAQAVTTVEVTAVTPMVTVDRPTVQSTVDRARIEQLPMNGRELRTLLRMLPGSEGGDGRRMYGMVDTAQEWLIDGAPVQDYRWNMVLDSYNPGVGAIQEFSVDSSAVSAKQSRPANVMIATKSGTNQLHGSAYETHRNSGLGVARSRTDYWEKPPHLVRNEFGVNVGGPMYIPGVYDGRNRSFWFFNYEGYRLRQPTTRGYTVPTAAMRNGDFSGLKDSQGRLQTLYDPNTTDPVTYARQPFSYGGKLNAIDPSRISPVAKYLFSITPMPTLPDVNPLLDVNYWVQTPYDWDKAAYITRIDHRFSDKDSIYGRFTQVGVDNLTALCRGAGRLRVTQARTVPSAESGNRESSQAFHDDIAETGVHVMGDQAEAACPQRCFAFQQMFKLPSRRLFRSLRPDLEAVSRSACRGFACLKIFASGPQDMPLFRPNVVVPVSGRGVRVAGVKLDGRAGARLFSVPPQPCEAAKRLVAPLRLSGWKSPRPACDVAGKPQKNPDALPAADRSGGRIHPVNRKLHNRLVVVPPGFANQKKAVVACLSGPERAVFDPPMSVHILSGLLRVLQIAPLDAAWQGARA